jgi:hypothetical protein
LDFTKHLQVQPALRDVKQQGIFQRRNWNNVECLLLSWEWLCLTNIDWFSLN